jgi:hypothetical protein
VLIYWFLLVFFAAGALSEGQKAAPGMPGAYPVGAYPTGATYAPQSARGKVSAMLVIGTLMTVALIGLRYRVGADWQAYVEIYHQAGRLSFVGAIQSGDPGYQAINWVVAQSGSEIWMVNLASAAIFGWGLLRFCAAQPRPWLAFAIAVPYLVIVVAMGYTRQAVALGVLMAGLARQTKGASALNFSAYVALAATFHSTSIIVFPLVAWSSRGSPVINAAILASVGIVLYQFFLGKNMDSYIANYLDTAYSSQGAFIRVSMNIIAAACFYIVGRRLEFEPHEYKVWRNFTLAAVVMMVLLAVLPSSTAVDRISLYLMPLQIAVISRLPVLSRNSAATAVGVILYVAAVEFVWLNYAQFSKYWIPYQFYPF